jgi:hypothetical protein
MKIICYGTTQLDVGIHAARPHGSVEYIPQCDSIFQQLIATRRIVAIDPE